MLSVCILWTIVVYSAAVLGASALWVVISSVTFECYFNNVLHLQRTDNDHSHYDNNYHYDDHDDHYGSGEWDDYYDYGSGYDDYDEGSAGNLFADYIGGIWQDVSEGWNIGIWANFSKGAGPTLPPKYFDSTWKKTARLTKQQADNKLKLFTL